MTLRSHIARSYKGLQDCWDRLADKAFRQSAPTARDEMARGEFISAFITEDGLTFPAATRKDTRH